MQKFEKTQKLGSNKYRCINHQKEYILTQQAISDYDNRLPYLDHPNFINIIDNWEENGVMCIIQNSEYLVQIKEGGLFREARILTIIQQLASALKVAQSNGIEATVTLCNVFLDESKNIKIDLLNLNATPLQYASPEVLRKQATLSGIWSIGVIAYFLANNRMPFTGDTDKTLAYNIIYKDPQPCDQGKFPILHKLLKQILTKNLEKRFTYQQTLDFLVNKIIVQDQPSSLFMYESKKQSMCSLKESKIDIIEQSISDKNNSFQVIKPQIPKIITLETFEDMHSVHRQLKNRPQSSTQTIVKNEQKELLVRLQRIRPNSAVGFSGKEFISRNIKQELSNRRIIKSSIETKQDVVNTMRNNFMQKQQFKEVSVDLKEAKQLKNEDVIRVYNLEYQNEQQYVSKRIHKPFQKVLKNNNTPKNLNQKELQFFDEIQDWRVKMLINMKQQNSLKRSSVVQD